MKENQPVQLVRKPAPGCLVRLSVGLKPGLGLKETSAMVKNARVLERETGERVQRVRKRASVAERGKSRRAATRKPQESAKMRKRGTRAECANENECSCAMRKPRGTRNAKNEN